jgi:hypothetical protein
MVLATLYKAKTYNYFRFICKYCLTRQYQIGYSSFMAAKQAQPAANQPRPLKHLKGIKK